MDLGTKIFLTGLVFLIAGIALRLMSNDDLRKENIALVVFILVLFFGGLLMLFVGPLVGIWG